MSEFYRDENGDLGIKMDFSGLIIKSPEIETVKQISNPSPTDSYTNEAEKQPDTVEEQSGLANQTTPYSTVLGGCSTNYGGVITSLPRKTRKSFVSCRPLDDTCVNQVGCLTIYSDWSYEYKYLFESPKEIPEICAVATHGKKQKDLFAVVFAKADVFVIGLKSKVTADGKYLYDLLRKQDVLFNPGLKMSYVKTTLYEKIAPKMAKPEKEIDIEFCAGWNFREKRYMYSESRPYDRFPIVNEFPVANRELVEQELTDNLLESYVCEMLRIRHWQDRTMIFLFPMVAILASLLKKKRLQIDLTLNLIVEDGIAVSDICNWLQILNRSRLLPVSMGTNRNAFQSKFSTYKDETMILDVRSFEGDTNHCRNVKNSRRMEAHQLAGHECGTEENINDFMLVVLSNDYFAAKDSFNIFLGKDTVKASVSKYSSNKVETMNSVIFEFVCFAEHEFDALLCIMEKHSKKDGITSTLNAVMEIAEKFWERYGIDIQKTLRIPNNTDFIKNYNSYNTDIDNVIDIFRKAVFDEVNNYEFFNKGSRENIGKVILIKKDWYCFPTVIMEEILKNHKIFYHKNRMMKELKKRQIIETDEGGGYTMRLKAETIQREHYCVKKEFFDEIGALELWQLGKEV